MKNKAIAVLLGLIGGIISVMYLSEAIKIVAAHLFINGDVIIKFHGLKLDVILPAGNLNSFFAIAAVTVTPFAACVFFIEASFLWLNKTSNDHIRGSIIVFQLINIGYIIFASFMGIISILLPFSLETDWTRFLNNESLTYNQKLIFMFLVLIILLAYINVLTKRIRKSIPVINKKPLTKKFKD